MKVILAGYNIDADITDALRRASKSKEEITPETIAAAYARISRSTKSVAELRREAGTEVAAARRSNKSIVFDMGHSSIAEHAVFNIDIIGVSRLLTEEIQRFRLCSFTEKSQRYVTLHGDFVIPKEIEGSSLKADFEETIAEQNRFYCEAVKLLVPHILQKHREKAAEVKMRAMLEGWAKEDARYALSLATQTQMGMTINARNLELMIRRFHALPFCEAHEFAGKLLAATAKIAPSLIRYTTATEYDKETRADLRQAFGSFMRAPAHSGKYLREVRLYGGAVGEMNNADDDLLAALLFSSSDISFAECRERIKKMSKTQKKRIFIHAFAKMESFDVPLREFENIPLLFEIIVSASCLAQIKRHRMASIHCQPYDISLGVKMPSAIGEIGMRGEFMEVMKKSERFYARLSAECGSASCALSYILTNAHRRRVLISLNAREMYHIARLRMDEHAQWDIRNIATEMIKQARRAMPLTMMMAVGKHEFKQKYADCIGDV